MERDTLKRFDRLVAILIQLQSKKIVKSQELVERFDVSLRTIYRDIKTLEKAGVPLYGEAGVGYSLVNGYRLPPVMFTQREANSFMAAEKLMQQLTDKEIRTHFQSAMYKIKSVLRGAEKDRVEALEQYISIYSARQAFNDNVPQALNSLFDSMVEKKQVKLTYQTLRDAHPVDRNIEPVGVFYENQYWYILGYCHLRKDYRQFRLDRIHNITTIDQLFTRTHGSVDEYRQQKKNLKTIEAKILVDKEVIHYLKYDRHFYGFVSEKTRPSGKVEMTFHICKNDEGFARWLLMFGDYAEILQPQWLKSTVNQLLHRFKLSN